MIILAYIDPGSGFTFVGIAGWLVTFLLGLLGIAALFLKRSFGFLRRHKRYAFILFFLPIVIIIIAGVTMTNKKPLCDRKIIVLGMDGLSPEIMEPMMAGGRLPHFASLKERGSYRRLATTNPPQSPVAWTAFATGLNPGESGVFDFITRDPKNYRLRLATSDISRSKPQSVVKSKRFWDYASRARIPATIINCPLTFPPDRIYGKMLSGMGVPDILGTEGTFSYYTTGAIVTGKDTGGKAFHIERSPVIYTDIIGPRVSGFSGTLSNAKVQLKISPADDGRSALFEFQGQRFKLAAGERSGWKETTFDVGTFGKIRGILKFHLLEVDPDIKLYISPINFDPRDPFFPISYPASYSKEITDAIGLYHTQGMPIDTWAVNEKRVSEESLLDEADEVLREKKAIFDYELKRMERGILFSYFGLTDSIQHIFWRYRDPSHPLYEKDAPARYREMVETWYEKMDGIVGDAMDNMGGKDIMIVLSDHGFDTFRRAVHVNSWLRENGYLVLKDGSARSGGELLKDVDWTKTKAYAIGFGAIYINRAGRETGGIVEPGEETRRLKKELSGNIRRWRDGKYGAPVINAVYDGEDIFHGIHAKDAPDLYIGFNKGCRASWQTALGAAPEGLIEDNMKKWSGDHLFDPALVPGVIFSNRRITKERPSIYDMAPTILRSAGLNKKVVERCDFAGEYIFPEE
ncbi:MAG: alkaline phosphatase family protein [Candidatus Omnitrophota bacterium]